MIVVDLPRTGVVAVDADDEDEDARCPAVSVLRSSQAGASAAPAVAAVRVLVEVLRRHGGIAPRALLGGVFVPGGDSVDVEVHVGARWGWQDGRTCRSRLWRTPFLVGLPEEFAAAVLHGVTEPRDPRLPPGVLTVDRAGFDVVESAAPVFGQAAAVLRQVLAAAVLGRDREYEAAWLAFESVAAVWDLRPARGWSETDLAAASHQG